MRRPRSERPEYQPITDELADLTIPQAAVYLDVTEDAVTAAIRRGHLRENETWTRTVSRDELDRYTADRRNRGRNSRWYGRCPFTMERVKEKS